MLFVVAATTLPVAPLAAAPARRVSARAEAGAVQRWSDPATWDGGVPAAGAVVTIPAGASVKLDVSPPALDGLQIDGSLRFAERDLSLVSDWVVVHGRLRVGTERRPFRHRATITLTGDDRSADVMGMGTKVLGVMGGTLDLHGRPVSGWTRLAATAPAGAKSVTLERDVPWSPGDRIVLASSDYWRTHDEERTITAVAGRTVELDRPLEYRHWGEIQTFGGAPVDERAEVGLLSRNVVVRGAGESLERGFGGHVMVMEGATARIEGVELASMGQRKTLRRYPVHFHLDGDAHGSYLMRSSVHDSFNRCVVVHGTNGLVIRDNVCSGHEGHGFFLEDGNETDNVIVGNLGLGTQKVEDGLLPSDVQPATFWVTNPDNVVRGNAAAGSDGNGFWYALPEHPIGLSADDRTWPRRTPLGEFRDNVAHSNGTDGLAVDGSLAADGGMEAGWYAPVADPREPRSETVEARFEGLTAYMNRWHGAWLGGRNLVLSGATLADNRTGAAFASADTVLEDSVVVGETANPGTTEPWEEKGPRGRAQPAFWLEDAPVIGFEFYDGKVGVRDSVFAEFETIGSRRAMALTHRTPTPFPVSPSNFAEGLRFVDAERVYVPDPVSGNDGDASSVFVDRDGSVTGTPGASVVRANPFLLDESCEHEPAWNAYVCTSDYVSFVAGAADGEAAAVPLTVTRPDGTAQRLNGCCRGATGAQTNLLARRSYELGFTGGVPPATRLVLEGAEGEWIVVSFRVDGPVRVTRYGRPVPAAAGLADLRSPGPSAYYLDPGTSTMHVRLYGGNAWEELRVTRL